MPHCAVSRCSPAERISFRQVNRKTGNRIRQQLVDTVTGELVSSEDKGRGYEIAENNFLMVEDQEVEQARLARAPVSTTNAPIVPSQATPHSKVIRRPEPELEGEEQETQAVPPVTFAKPENTRTIEIDRFFRTIKLILDILRSYTISLRAKP